MGLAARTRTRAWVNDKYALSANNNLRLFTRSFGTYRRG